MVLFGPCTGARFARGALASFHLTQLRGFAVWFPPATELRLFPRGNATAREVGATTGDTPRSVSAVTLRVAEALAALALLWALRGHVRFHRHWQAAEFAESSHF